MENVNKQLLDALKRYLDCDPTSTLGGDTPANQARSAIAAAEQAQAEPKEMDAVPAYAYRYAAHVMENIRGASQWCDCPAFDIADSWINETQGGTMLPVCQTCDGNGMIGGLLPNGGGHDSEPCPDCAAQKGSQ